MNNTELKISYLKDDPHTSDSDSVHARYTQYMSGHEEAEKYLKSVGVKFELGCDGEVISGTEIGNLYELTDGHGGD